MIIAIGYRTTNNFFSRWKEVDGYDDGIAPERQVDVDQTYTHGACRDGGHVYQVEAAYY